MTDREIQDRIRQAGGPIEIFNTMSRYPHCKGVLTRDRFVFRLGNTWYAHDNLADALTVAAGLLGESARLPGALTLPRETPTPEPSP